MPSLSTSHASSLAAIGIISALGLIACSNKQDSPPAANSAEAPPAEAAAAQSSQNVFTFRVGELTAMALRDGGIELENDNQVLGVGRTPQEVAEVLSANGLPTDKVQLSVQPLLVKSADRVMLFDTGAGTLFGPNTGKLAGSLAETGVDPASVTDIFISHSHGDHVGGLVNAEGKPNYPNATVHMSKPEWEHMSAQADYASMVAALEARLNAFAPGAELVPGIVKAVEVKGHTPGHSAYRIGSGSESLLYVGDSMHHYIVSVQKPGWTISFDGDSATAAASRAKLIADAAAGSERIYAVHFPFPGIGKFEQRGEGFAWVAE
jgi:glyoxylase-like metal-dependent hydrolase (beta-lactamase superfamily II)